jgi:hypothetical protein
MQVEVPQSRAGDTAGDTTCENALLLRNYDDTEAAVLTVTVADPNDEIVHTETYTVGPLITRTVDLPLADGVYSVSARTGLKSSTCPRCWLSDEPTEIAAVETGNGVISVVEGV